MRLINPMSTNRCQMSDPLRIAAIVLLSSLSFNANCQKIDSLKTLLPKKTGIERAEILYNLAYEYVDFDYKLAQQFSMQAFSAAAVFGDSLLMVKAGRMYALALARDGKNESSTKWALKVLPIARRNSFERELKQILNRLGIDYTHFGRYDSALIYHFESLSLREKNGDAFEIGMTLGNVGFVYFLLKDYDKALSFFGRAREFQLKLDKPDLDVVLLNISACYIYKRQFDLARNYIDEALSFCKEDCSSRSLMIAKLHLGLISCELKKFEEAKRYFAESYNLAEGVNDVRYKLDNVANLLDIARWTNDLRRNNELLQKAENLLKEDVSPHSQATINMYHVLFESYGFLRNLEKLAFYQNKYIQLKDSVYNEELTTSLMRVEADYMEKENKTKIESQAKVLSLTNEMVKRQRTINLIIGLVAVLAVGFVVLLVVTVRQKKHANILLEKKVFERTVQLENQHNLLRKSLQEREIQLERMTSDIRSSLATIKGLGLLVLHDVNVLNASAYVDKIEKTSNSLLEGLNLAKPDSLEQ